MAGRLQTLGRLGAYGTRIENQSHRKALNSAWNKRNDAEPLETLTKRAKGMVALGIVVLDQAGFRFEMRVGKFNQIPHVVTENGCDCPHYEDHQVCVHSLAVQMFKGELELAGMEAKQAEEAEKGWQDLEVKEWKFWETPQDYYRFVGA